MINRAFVLAVGLVAFAAAGAEAKQFRFADTRDIISMEPHYNLTHHTAFMQNIYEPLVQANSKGELDAKLATEWKQTGPTIWEFKLRRGVKFQEGQAFTADDVVFSYERAAKPTSTMTAPMAQVKRAIKVDDFTVQIETKDIDPILPREIQSVLIMSKDWSIANRTEAPVDRTSSTENFSTRHANGTGPFKLVEWTPGVSTELVPNANWWGGKRTDALTSAKYFVISNPSTQLASLAAGEIDLLMNPGPSVVERMKGLPNVRVVQTADLRTMMFGFDMGREELLDSNVKGKNPFKDVRVREAFYYVIDVPALVDKVMRGYAVPTDLLVGPGINGFDPELNKQAPVDVPRARKLMADAGYPDGFEISFECTAEYYINDQALCTAVSAMLAQIGVKTRLAFQPGTQFMTKVQRPNYGGTFFIYGYAISTFDSYSIMGNILRSRDPAKGLGAGNVGDYKNPEMDRLLDAARSEVDQEKRTGLLKQAWAVYRQDRPFLPLFQVAVVLSLRDNVAFTPDPLNRIYLPNVTLN